MSAAPHDQAPPAGAAGEWGCFSVGGMDLALPMSALREVVPCRGLTSLPGRAPGVVGGLDLRGVTLPVLDLCALLDRPSALTEMSCAVVIVLNGRLLGVVADHVGGIFTADSGSLAQATDAAQAPVLFAGSIRRADTGERLTRLSLDALAALPDVPWLADPEPERQAQASDHKPGELEADADVMSLLLVRCGPLRLAVNAMVVHATLADPVLRPSTLVTPLCVGIVTTYGRRAPAVDLSQLVGADPLPPGARRQAIVIARQGGLVVCLVEQVMEIVRISPAAVRPLPAFAVPRPGLFEGTLAGAAAAGPGTSEDVASGTYLVINGAALLELPEIASMAAANVIDGDATDDARRQTSAGGRGVITVRAPGELAIPIEHVSEILPHDDRAPEFGSSHLVKRITVVRGRSVPVISLERVLGSPEAPAETGAAVLVVTSGDAHVGFAVPGLKSIEHAHSEYSLPSRAGGGDPVASVLSRRSLAQVGNGDQQRTIPVLDLQNLADAFVANGVSTAGVRRLSLES